MKLWQLFRQKRRHANSWSEIFGGGYCKKSAASKTLGISIISDQSTPTYLCSSVFWQLFHSLSSKYDKIWAFLSMLTLPVTGRRSNWVNLQEMAVEIGRQIEELSYYRQSHKTESDSLQIWQGIIRELRWTLVVRSEQLLHIKLKKGNECMFIIKLTGTLSNWVNSSENGSHACRQIGELS